MNEENHALDIESLKKCIEAVEGKTRTVGVKLQEIRVQNDELKGQLDLSSRATERCDIQILFTKEYCHVNLTFGYSKDIDLLAIKNLFSEYLKKTHQAIMDTEHENIGDFVLVFDFLSKQEDATYAITAVNPIFLMQEDTMLRMVFDVRCVRYNIEHIDYSDIEEEIAYEAKEREEALLKAERKKYGITEDEMDIDEMAGLSDEEF